MKNEKKGKINNLLRRLKNYKEKKISIFEIKTLIKEIKPYVNRINTILIAFFIAVMIIISAAISYQDKKTSYTSYNDPCNIAKRAMDRANHAYLYGGGSKAEFEEARRIYINVCVE